MRKIFAITIMLFAPSVVFADGPPSDSEREAIVASMAAAGCTGGRIEKDDGGFEVDDATCDGVPRFDLHLNAAFEIVSKQQDD